jgi:hypothetical protein
MERGSLLLAEIRELTDAAAHTAATMTATAAEVVSTEHAVSSAPHYRSYLAPTGDALIAQLHNGRLRQHDEMVTAAARRNSHRRNAIGVFGEHRADVEFTGDAATLPARTGERDRSPARLGAGVRRTPASCAGPTGQMV